MPRRPAGAHGGQQRTGGSGIAEVTAPARVASRDGTRIAFWTTGTGPPLVLVHGTTSNHSTWHPLLPYLEPHATIHAMDRRGRGASDDGPVYDLAREFEDVAAVVDAAASASGSPVDVLGHSFGGLCAFGAATLTPNVGRLVLYEGWPSPDPGAVAYAPDVARRLDALLAAGDHEAAIATFYREVVMMSDDELDEFRALPSWHDRVAAAHTIPREDAAVAAAPLDPEQAATVTVPVLMLVGGDSPDTLAADPGIVATALPDARIVVLEGQQHIAHRLIPEAFAAHVVAFLRAG